MTDFSHTSDHRVSEETRLIEDMSGSKNSDIGHRRNDNKKNIKIEEIDLESNTDKQTVKVMQCTCCTNGEIIRIRTAPKHGTEREVLDNILYRNPDNLFGNESERKSSRADENSVKKKSDSNPWKIFSCACIECICPGFSVSDRKVAPTSSILTHLINHKNIETTGSKPNEKTTKDGVIKAGQPNGDGMGVRATKQSVGVDVTSHQCCCFPCIITHDNKTDERKRNENRHDLNHGHIEDRTDNKQRTVNDFFPRNYKSKKRKNRKKKNRVLEYDIPLPYLRGDLQIDPHKGIIQKSDDSKRWKRRVNDKYRSSTGQANKRKENDTRQNKHVHISNKTAESEAFRFSKQHEIEYNKHVHIRYTPEYQPKEASPISPFNPFDDKDSIINGVFYRARASKLKHQMTNYTGERPCVRSKAYVPSDSQPYFDKTCSKYHKTNNHCTADVLKPARKKYPRQNAMSGNLDDEMPNTKYQLSKRNTSKLNKKRKRSQKNLHAAPGQNPKGTTKQNMSIKCDVWVMESPTSPAVHTKETKSCFIELHTESNSSMGKSNALKECEKSVNPFTSKEYHEHVVKPLKKKCQTALASNTIDRVKLPLRASVSEKNTNEVDKPTDSDSGKQIISKRTRHVNQKPKSTRKTIQSHHTVNEDKENEDEGGRTVDIHDIGVNIKPPHYSMRQYKLPPSKVFTM